MEVKALFQAYNWFGTEFQIFGEFKINTDDRQHIKAPHMLNASVHAFEHSATPSPLIRVHRRLALTLREIKSIQMMSDTEKDSES